MRVAMQSKIGAYLFLLFCAISLTCLGWWIDRQFMRRREIDEYELVRQFLLNDNPLPGVAKPKLWVHSRTEVNARDWRNQAFRNARANAEGANAEGVDPTRTEPYLALAVDRLIRHCGDEFHLCLVDDRSFAKLIPGWAECGLDMSRLTDPVLSQARELGMLYLIYFYGGMRVPESFVCLRPLGPLYEAATKESANVEVADMVKTDSPIPFVGECANRLSGATIKTTFAPTTQFMGARKGSEIVKDWCEMARRRAGLPALAPTKKPLFGALETPAAPAAAVVLASERGKFDMPDELVVDHYVRAKKAVRVDGTFLGTKDVDGRPIGVEQLLGSYDLALMDHAVGVWIPRDDVCRRTKYARFAEMSVAEFLAQDTAAARLFL